MTTLTSSPKALRWLSILALVLGLAISAKPADAASDDFYSWAKWRLGHAPYTCQAGATWVRPNVRQHVPESWWTRLQQYRPKPCPPASDQPVQSSALPIANVTLTAREQALLEAVNAARQQHGLAPIPVGASLERAARDHTADMIRFGYLGHDWHNGSPFGTWVNRYTPCSAGEILAWRSPQQTPSGAVQQWLNSPGHRAALLSHGWAVMGVGLTQKHAVVVFAGRCGA